MTKTKADLEAEIANLRSGCDALTATIKTKETENADLRHKLDDAERRAKSLPKVPLQHPTYQDEAGAKDSQRPPAIYSVQINSVDAFCPPLKVLDVALVADTLFLGLRAYDENHETVAMTSIPDADIAVDIDSLLEVLWVMRRDNARMKGKKWG